MFDATSALRSGLSSSKKATILTERVPSSLLPSTDDTVSGAAASMAATLAAQHHTTVPVHSRETVALQRFAAIASFEFNQCSPGKRRRCDCRQRLVRHAKTSHDQGACRRPEDPAGFSARIRHRLSPFNLFHPHSISISKFYPTSPSIICSRSQPLQHRDALNPAAFYKKSAQRLPEYFQVGTVIQGATEFYSSRLSKQQRGRTFAEELLHDGDVKHTLKKRFTKLQVGGAPYCHVF